MFWDALDQIEEFVSTSGSKAFMTMGEDNHPVLCLPDTEAKSGRYYELRLGLHKCRLLLHWKNYLQMFVQSEGTELPEPNMISSDSDP